jgi:curli biogenesis system outer membrane secretion channel CsgG
MKTPFFAVRISFIFSLSILLPLATVPAASGAEKTVPTIVVAKTEPKGIGHWQPAMGEGLAQMLITELSKLENMKVLESVALEDLREERRLGENGEVSGAEAVKKGAWKGADYTFKSVVTEFGSKEANYGGGGRVPVPGIGGARFIPGGFSVRKSENRVRIDWRIIDNTTREIVKGATGSAEGIESGTGFNFSSWHGGGFSNNREFMGSALGKATVKAMNQIVEEAKKINLGPGARTAIQEAETKAAALNLRRVAGAVELVDGKDIWISLGSKNGFAKGDKIKIYQPIEKKNQAGKVVLTIKKEAGEIVLSKVQRDKSMGEYQGAGKISEGWIAADAAIDIDSLEEATEK